jgi:ATP synthase protein I
MAQGSAGHDVKASPPPSPAPDRRPGPRAGTFATLASRPIRTVLAWQALATLAGAAVSAIASGRAAAMSAALGGGITVVSTVVYALVLGIGGKATAGASVLTMLRAEGAKILVIFAGLWWALARVPGLRPLPMFATFVVAVLLFSAGFLARDRK